MPVEKLKITFDEKDLKALIAEKYGLILDKTTISIGHDQHDRSNLTYYHVTIEGEKHPENILNNKFFNG